MANLNFEQDDVDVEAIMEEALASGIMPDSFGLVRQHNDAPVYAKECEVVGYKIKCGVCYRTFMVESDQSTRCPYCQTFNHILHE